MNLIGIVRALAAFSWLAVLGAIAFTVARAARGQKVGGGTTLVIVVIVLAVALNIVSAGLFFVQPFESGVVVTIASGGVKEEPLEPGLRWVIPFAENVVTYPTERRTYTMSIAAGEGQLTGDDSVESRTSDGQLVLVDASVIYAVDKTQVVEIHRTWRDTYVDGLIRPLARGIIRDAVSLFGIEEVYSIKRAELTQNISDELTRKMAVEGFIVVDFVLRNIAFSPEYAASVEQKQIAEQQAQQAAFVVQQREQEAEQARQVAEGEADAAEIRARGQANALVINAQGVAESRLITAQAEAEALTLLAQAIRVNPDVLILEYIEKLSDQISVMLLPSDNPFLLPLPGLP